LKVSVLAIIACLAISISQCLAADLSRLPTETIIDELTSLDAQAPGIDDSDTYDVFMADGSLPVFEGGIIPADVPKVPPQMRELVRRGVTALPFLIQHLSDKRATHIEVGSPYDRLQTVGGQFFTDEYDPRDESQHTYYCDPFGSSNTGPQPPICQSFNGKYVVKVGDVCEVLVGQIVNRRLNAVQYQPTLIIFVNSPLETPSLAKLIRDDWGGLNTDSHAASLIADLRSEKELAYYQDALRRLRFYYPERYASLQGSDLQKRTLFEAAERKTNSAAQQ
jgi:hypothetical protein